MSTTLRLALVLAALLGAAAPAAAFTDLPRLSFPAAPACGAANPCADAGDAGK